MDVQNLVAARKAANARLPLLTFQFLVSKQNEHEIETAEKIAKEIGIDQITFKTIQVYDFENGNSLIPENENYSRYKRLSDGAYVLKNKYRNSCWRMWSSCVFTWDGSIVPCCFDKDADHKMGNVTKAEFKKIWRSAIYKEFRQKILKDRQQIEICKNCSEGSKVWI